MTFTAKNLNFTVGGDYTGSASDFVGVESGTITAGGEIILDGIVVGKNTTVNIANAPDGSLLIDGVPFSPANTSTPTSTSISAALEIPADFNESGYLQANPDVANAVNSGQFDSGYHHYQLFGLAEGRSFATTAQSSSASQAHTTNKGFDEAFYLAKYPDVDQAVNNGQFDSGYHHFQLFGQYENRETGNDSPSQTSTPATTATTSSIKGFDSNYYLQQNQDVANANVDALTHYITYGQFEGRNPNAEFEESFYLQQYSDVKNAVDAGQFDSGYSHYIHFGHMEGRFAEFADTLGDDLLFN